MGVVQLMMSRQCGDIANTRRMQAVVENRSNLQREILRTWRGIARRRTTAFEANSNGVLWRIRS